MSETHLYLVRHGETDFNLQGIVQGRGVNTSLNETGRQQAAALATRFAQVEIDIIFSSPLFRAVQTAEHVSRAKGGMLICTDDNLEEMSWGVFEGQERSDHVSAAFAEMRERWHQGDHDFAPERGESLTQVQSRGVQAVHNILNQHAGKRILVLTHGRFLRILLASLLTEYGIPRMEELEHTNTGVNFLVHDGSRFEAKSLNCTSHLL